VRSTALVLALLLAACLPQQTTPSPTPSPTLAPAATPTPGAALGGRDMRAALLAKPIPVADPFELARRIKGRSGTPAAPFQPARAQPPDESVGTTQEFWVYDFEAKRNVRVTAGIRLVTPSAKWWVQTDVTVDESALARSAQVFEQRIYPTDRRLFGEEWSPGIDADPRVNVLIARLPGSAAGYFSQTDALPRWVNEFSAEREMIYMNALAARVGTDPFHAVLAHELCHMIQFNVRARSSVWFNEGQAQLCERANGFRVGFDQLFLQQPNTQIDAWSELDEGAAQHYGASYLFLEYLRGRTGGGYEFITELMRRGVDTLADIDRALRDAGHPGADEMLADFVAANALVGTTGADPVFDAYPLDARPREPARPTSQDRALVGATLRAAAHPQATRYVELPRSGPFTVTLAAPEAGRVVPTESHSGTWSWWSDRADGMDSSLTREVDLSGVASATLRFWTWFDIEDDFDYAYVLISSDGGARWTTLPATGTTTADPNGNNLGTGYTGLSGGGQEAAWVQQQADLTPFAGQKVLLRFEHVTDGALNSPGFLLDDVEIPEIGYRDDAEEDRGWNAEGFIRSTNTIAMQYVVQVIRFGARPTVERRVVAGGRLELELDPTGDQAAPVLAVTPLAPRMTESVAFEITVTARR